MYFTVLLTTDETYRREFTDDVGNDIRQILAVRYAYHVARGMSGAHNRNRDAMTESSITVQSDLDARRSCSPTTP